LEVVSWKKRDYQTWKSSGKAFQLSNFN